MKNNFIKQNKISSPQSAPERKCKVRIKRDENGRITQKEMIGCSPTEMKALKDVSESEM